MQLEGEGIQKHLLVDGWSTKLFSNSNTGVRVIYFSKKYFFPSPIRVTLQHALLKQSQNSSPQTRLVY